MRFFITTLGCKVNQYDGAATAGRLVEAGLRKVGDPRQADLIVVVTCCVTTTAMSKSRQAIRRAVRAAKNPAVLVTGCYGDYDADGITKLLGALGVQAGKSSIVGYHKDLTRSIDGFLHAITARSPQDRDEGHAPVIRNPANIHQRRLEAIQKAEFVTSFPIKTFDDHQRAFVKVQDGCDAFCSYCIVPFTRPHVRSRPVSEITDECRLLIDAGHREIILCGVFLGAYNRTTAIGLPEAGQANPLARLLSAVGELRGLWRVRMSSLEPGDLTDDLLSVCRDSPAVAPHFHLPLQSGSDAVLRRMNRRYTSADFARTADRLRGAIDRPAITTDVIVGFPGETDDDFNRTLAAARQAGFAKIHAFPFSPIEGTAAFQWRSECPPPSTVKDRLARLADLEAELAGEYRRPFVGHTMEGLIESPRTPPAKRQAMTDRYLTVFFDPPGEIAPSDLTGRVAAFAIDGLCQAGLTARLTDPV